MVGNAGVSPMVKGQWYFDAVEDRDQLWLKFLSFRGLCCQVAVTPHAWWGVMRQWGSGVVG